MQNKIQVKSVEKRENALIFCAENSEIEVKGLSARNHVLVDSDNLSFLYILENESSFIYVSIPHTCWEAMHEAMNNDVVMFVRVNDIEMELEGLKEEVEYLVENIEGNANTYIASLEQIINSHEDTELENAKTEINLWFKPDEIIEWSRLADRWIYDIPG